MSWKKRFVASVSNLADLWVPRTESWALISLFAVNHPARAEIRRQVWTLIEAATCGSRRHG